MYEYLISVKEFIFYSRQRLKRGRLVRLFHLFNLYVKLKRKEKFIISHFDTTTVDIVIPTIAKDYPLLETVIDSVRKNLLQPIGKIYIVCPPSEALQEFCAKNNLELINEETLLGYNKSTIQYKVNGVDRSGWMFQQLLKLSGDKFAERDNYIVVDSDTVMVSPNSFLENSKFVFFQNKEWHEPYFQTFKKLFGFSAGQKLSFTSHMMIFNKHMLTEMKQNLEEKNNLSWDKAYMLSIGSQKEASCISDYDTYAGWVYAKHRESVIEKPLYNRSLSRKWLESLDQLERKYGGNYKTISFHSYIR